MATEKIWTASDIEMGVMRLNRVGLNLTLSQSYKFVDENDDELPGFPKKYVSETEALADLPVAIKNALSTINEYLYDKALEKEGME